MGDEGDEDGNSDRRPQHIQQLDGGKAPTQQFIVEVPVQGDAVRRALFWGLEGAAVMSSSFEAAVLAIRERIGRR